MHPKKAILYSYSKTLGSVMMKLEKPKYKDDNMLLEKPRKFMVWKMIFAIIINILFKLFSTIIVVIIVPMILLDGVHNSEIVGFSILRIVTASMEPELPLNSLIVVRHDDPNNLEVRQIATYMREDGALSTLRIYQIEKDDDGNNVGFIFKSDANHHLDNQIVSSENIVGRVVLISYTIEQILMFFHARILSMIVITIFLLIVKLCIAVHRVIVQTF